jgi:hypothetical protein
MKTRAPKHRFYPSRFARLLLLAMQDELGEYSTATLLQQAGLSSEFPSDSLERNYPFVQLAALNQSLQSIYGDQGGRALAMAVGQRWFGGLTHFGAFGAFADPAYQRLPADTRAGVSLRVLSEVFSRVSDQQTTLEAQPASYRILVPNSPFIYKGAQAPTCHFFAGLLTACLEAATGGLSYVVRETECKAVGGEQCTFLIGKKPLK